MKRKPEKKPLILIQFLNCISTHCLRRVQHTILGDMAEQLALKDVGRLSRVTLTAHCQIYTWDRLSCYV